MVSISRLNLDIGDFVKPKIRHSLERLGKKIDSFSGLIRVSSDGSSIDISILIIDSAGSTHLREYTLFPLDISLLCISTAKRQKGAVNIALH